MQTFGFILIPLILLATSAHGTINPIPVQSPEKERNMLSSLLIHEDSSKKLTVEDIRAIPVDQFATMGNTKTVIGFSSSAFWVRFDLENKLQVPYRLFLEYGYPTVDSIDLYVPDADQKSYLKKASGDTLSASSRDVRYRLPVFVIDVPSGRSSYFIRLESEGVLQFPLKLWEPEAFHEKRFAETGFLGMSYGFIVVMVLYNIFLAIMLRSFITWIYVLFISTSICNFMGYQGLWVIFAPQSLSSWLSNQGFIMASGFLPVFATVFTFLFLDMKKRPIFWQGLTLSGGVIGLLVIFISLFNYNLAAKISNVNSAFTCLSLLGVSISVCFQRYRPAYFYSLAWLVTLLGNIATPLAVTGLIPVNIFTTWGAFLGVAVETVLISLALGDRMRLAQENAARAIRELNEGLEDKVEEKTRDIKAIMSHIKLGIFAVETADHVIHKDYSKHLEELMNLPNLAKKPAVPLLLKGARLSEDVKGQIRSVFESSIGEDEIAFTANESCLPHEIVYDRGTSQQVFEFDWSPMINKSGKVERILVTCKDVSDLRRIQNDADLRKKELEYIGELINIPQDSFGKFASLFLELFRENQRLLLSNENFKQDLTRILFINLHTLKGSCRSLGFKALTDLIHSAEDTLVGMQKNRQSWNRDTLISELQAIKILVDEYERINSKRLNRSASVTSRVEISVDDLENQVASIETLQKFPDHSVMDAKLSEMKRTFSLWAFRSAEDAFREFCEPISTLARDLGKQNPAVQLIAPDVYLTHRGVELLRKTFVHLLRNALDHGIEEMEERVANGKSPAGCISIEAEVDKESYLCIRVRDDGRGLALKMITQIALIKNFIQHSQSLSALELGRLIFRPEFTTSSSVNDISGRGVGMDAVKSWLENSYATVDIELEGPIAVGSVPDFIAFSLIVRIPPQFYRKIESVRLISQVA